MSAQDAIDAADNQLAEDGAHEADPLPLRASRETLCGQRYRKEQREIARQRARRADARAWAECDGREYDPAANEE